MIPSGSRRREGELKIETGESVNLLSLDITLLSEIIKYESENVLKITEYGLKNFQIISYPNGYLYAAKKRKG